MKSRKLAKSSVVRRSIYVKGRTPSISLEPQFWAALDEIASERGTSVTALVRNVDADRGNANLCSAIRVFVLRHYQDQISTIQTPTA